MRSSKPDPETALAGFHKPVQDWFRSSFQAPTAAQELGWPAIQRGEHTLLLAPTGSGKTLAAFLAAIDHVMFSPAPARLERCRALYISPLKALAVDVERNLRAPIVGVTRAAERSGETVLAPAIHVRTGDTPARDRATFLRNPADILITTPESLYLLLTSNAREVLRPVRWVILDEIHAVVNTKRGSHLALSLERLAELTWQPFQRIGLSATQRPLDEVARFLGGFELAKSGPESPDAHIAAERTSGQELAGPEPTAVELTVPNKPGGTIGSATELASDGPLNPPVLGDLTAGPSGSPADELVSELSPEGVQAALEAEEHPPIATRTAMQPRPVTIVDAGSRKQLELRVEVPVEDMARLGEVVEIPSGPASQGDVRSSIWPAIHPLILDLIRSHRSTLIFVNSRRLAERLSAALNELAGEEIVQAHHGSIAREQRLLIEDALKSGKLPAIVATSSLELGIDMGAIDLVIQVEAPPSVAGAIQRIGRAGHQIGTPSKGIIIPKYRGDLLACAALTERMEAGAVEHMRYPRNPLDILAQQLVAMVGMEEWSLTQIERVIRRAAPFAELPRTMLEQVLDMLSGRYPSDEFSELRPRITWDRLNGTLRAREGSRRVAVTNGGTIPDRGLYGVFLAGAEKGQGRVGELDEEMVFESHPGEVFLLGASSWRIEEITHDRVLVSPAPGQPGKMPYWHGDPVGRPLEFGRAIGALTRKLSAMENEEAETLLQEKHSLDPGAARNLLQYLEDQVEATGAAPDDRTLLVESCLDEMGDWRVCLLSPFGARVHAPWAMAIEARLRAETDIAIDMYWTDDGIVIRFPEAESPPPVEMLLPDPDEVEELVIRQLGSGGRSQETMQGSVRNSLFATRFRECAGRALLLPRRNPGQRAPLWQQRRRAADLLTATAKFGSFPIILETFRECLKDVFDIPALVELLRDIRSGKIRVRPVTTSAPSPFAASIMFSYVANFIYEGDAPLAERRAQALMVDPAQLRELLGDAEMRELLDPEALTLLELTLQHLTPDRAVKHADGLHDLLIRLGDLSRTEIEARAVAGADVEGWLSSLSHERRVMQLPIAGDLRYVATEDAGRYRDALGIPPPPGLPGAFLEYVRDPIGDLVARYARTHGPFRAADLAARFALGAAPVAAALNLLESVGRVVEGEFRPGGAGREWCDSGVLRAIRQKSLARLRHEVEPVDHPALGRFYVAWHGVGRGRRPAALVDVIEQIQDAQLVASELESRILPARIEGYDSRRLDELTASGEVIWVGCEPLGQHDGRISLYLAETAHLLLRPGALPADQNTQLYDAIRGHLQQRGASFFPQIAQSCGTAFPSDVRQALWDLVWAGEVTNDTLQPLRAYLAVGSKSSAVRRTSQSRASLVVRRPMLRGTGRTQSSPSTLRASSGETSGRWSLVSSLIFGEATVTERMAARAGQLLERYGVISREAAAGIEGGFSSVYGVLRAMEEAGRVRRGYFVSGLGAAQFAAPGAVDRLRALREPPEEPQGVMLAATDPANPYGAALPWPERPEGRRPMRSAGATVILVDGALAAWSTRDERQILTFLEQLPEEDSARAGLEVGRTLAAQVGPRRRAVVITEVDGRSVHESPLADYLAEAGFQRTYAGYVKRLG